MAERFSATVERWTSQTKEDLHAVFQLAVQNVLEEVVSHTPRDTGFLQASLKASTVGFAPLVDGRGAIGGTYQVDAYEVTIAGSDLGDTIYANFTARYAKYVEDGTARMGPRKMVALSVQNWQRHVNRAVGVIRGR